VLLTPVCLAAQSTVTSQTALRSEPNAGAVAQVRSGASVSTSTTERGWSKVTLEGYVHRSVVGGRRGSYSISVHADGGAYLRSTPSRSGRVLALVADGSGLTKVSTRGEWIRVRRTGWLTASVLQPSEPTVASRKRESKKKSRCAANARGDPRGASRSSRGKSVRRHHCGC